jgi:hypothetical protein
MIHAQLSIREPMQRTQAASNSQEDSGQLVLRRRAGYRRDINEPASNGPSGLGRGLSLLVAVSPSVSNKTEPMHPDVILQQRAGEVIKHRSQALREAMCYLPMQSSVAHLGFHIRGT